MGQRLREAELGSLCLQLPQPCFIHPSTSPQLCAGALTFLPPPQTCSLGKCCKAHCVRDYTTKGGTKNISSAMAHAFQSLKSKKSCRILGIRKGGILEDLLGGSGTMWCFQMPTPHHSRRPLIHLCLLPPHLPGIFFSSPKNGFYGNYFRFSL